MNVVFDFGAVLFSWRPVDIVAEVFPDRAAHPEQARQLAAELFGHEDWADFDRGLLPAEAVVQRTSLRLGLHHDTLHGLVNGIGARLLPMRESVDIVHALLGKRDRGEGVRGLYYLSNMPEPYARELESAHPFLQHFDGGIFSADVKLSKPDKRIYETLQTRYGLRPERTLFIDDMPVNVEAAKALGWRGIQFSSAAQLAQALTHELQQEPAP